MADLLLNFTSGQNLPAASLNTNFQAIEDSFSDLGSYIISGLTPTAGTGLAVNVALGVAFIGGRVTKAAGFTISGLAPSTTNHLYLLQAGTGTSNTTGTAPAESVKLGTATTDGSGVTAVATNWTSGREPLVRLEDAIHGSGAGHPRSINLASHHASNLEGNEVRGTLPSTAVDLTSTVILAPTSSTRNIIQGTGVGVAPLLIRQFSSGQTAALLSVQDSTGAANLVRVLADGSLLVGSSATGVAWLEIRRPAVAGPTVRQQFRVVAPADTAITASTEAQDIQLSLNRTQTWAAGALTSQRAIDVRAPTYAFDGASTITNAVTLYIDNAPQAGANATLTNQYAIWVDAGMVRLDGNVQMGGALAHQGSTAGFFNTTPTTKPGTYTITNVTPDRAYDANATTLDEVADCLGTLVADLKLLGLIG